MEFIFRNPHGHLTPPRRSFGLNSTRASAREDNNCFVLFNLSSELIEQTFQCRATVCWQCIEFPHSWNIKKSSQTCYAI